MGVARALRADLDRTGSGASSTRWWRSCAPLLLLPGPNRPAYYFMFRAIGHFLSMRGARQGLSRITWSHRVGAACGDFAAVALDADARAAIEHVGTELGLTDLARFVEGASGHRPSAIADVILAAP